MDVDNLLVYEGPVAFLRVLLGCIPEETTADGFLNSHCRFATGHHVQFMSEEDGESSVIFSRSRKCKCNHENLFPLWLSSTCP